MSGRTSFLAELKRRNVFRAAAAYLALGWVITQVTATVAPVLHLPESALPLVVWIGIIGFPFVLVFSWVFELTPEGLKLERDVERSASAAHVTASRLDKLAIGLCSVAIVLFLVDRFVPRSAAPAAAPAATAAGSAAPAQPGSSAAAGIPRKSIAVLPFTDLSPGHDQEYFSDGMAEELLNALAKVKDLKVAGRTSSFSFKGKNEDLRQIGQTLAVANVLEGSVRKQGDKVRITAQLIQASDGYHLWSDTFDGDMTDVFELQERIARAITDQLKPILEGDQQQRLVAVATANPEAYALYLKATIVFNQRNGPKFDEAIAELNEAIRLDPLYARAHSKLAALYAVATNYTAIDADEAARLGEREARRAIELEPTLAEANAVLGQVSGNQRQYLQARAATERALELDPRDVTVNFWLGIELISAGYTALGVARLDRTLEIDPLYPNAQMWRGFQYLVDGDTAHARSLSQHAADSGLRAGNHVLAEIAHAEGRDAEAVEYNVRGSVSFMTSFPDPDRASRLLAEGMYGDAAARARAVAMIDAYLATKPKVISGAAPWALLHLGEPARALAVAEPAPTGNDPLFFRLLWSPQGAAARRLPQFPEFVRKVGWTDVWEKYGPPDLCKRRGPGDYVCE